MGIRILGERGYVSEAAMKKLTLSMDEETIQQAKRIAAEQGTSVSAMFSRLVHAMAYKRGEKIEIGPKTRSLTGIISLPEGKTWRDVVTDALMEKHGIGG
jgi:hypothetical protein